MTALQWEEPPAHRYGWVPRQNWALIAEQLRSRPGEWAVIDTDLPATLAVGMRKGRNKSFPLGQFEFRNVGVKGGRAAKLYARYIGAVAP